MISLVPVGEVDRGILQYLKPPLEEVFGQNMEMAAGIGLTDSSRDKRRNQHLASALLTGLPQPGPGDRVLGVVDVDIFAPGLNFVFGVAELEGRKAIMSLQRLRQEYYGLPEDGGLFQERVIKEAVHEMGHTYGLKHCPDGGCVMHFSNSLGDTDNKGRQFCAVCRGRLSGNR